MEKLLRTSLLLFFFTIPLKENWNSISLIIFLFITIFINLNRVSVREKLSRWQVLALLLLILSLFTILINHENIDHDFKVNSFSFPALLVLFSFLFQKKILIFTLKSNYINAIFIGLSISGITRIVLTVINHISFDLSLFAVRTIIPFHSIFSPNPIIFALILSFCWGHYIQASHKRKLTHKQLLLIGLLCTLYINTYFSIIGLFVFLFTSAFMLLSKCYKQIIFKVTPLIFFSAFALFTFVLTDTGLNYLRVIDGDGSRVRNYQMSLKTINKLPLFGHGVGNEITSIQAVRNPNSWEYEKKYNLHNQFFEIIIGGGWCYFLLFFLMLIEAQKVFIKKRSVLGINFLFLIIITMFFESLLITQKGFYFTSFFLAYFIFEDE